jgi:hypothetical protein
MIRFGLRSYAIVKKYCYNNTFNLDCQMKITFYLDRPIKTNKKITFKQLFNVI